MNSRKAAIITGAGSGVGRATAIILAQRGYNVMLAGRTQEKLQETAEMVSGDSETIISVCDVGDGAAARKMVDTTIKAFGRVDAVVNNAGVAPMASMENNTAELCRQVVNTNLTGVMNVTAAAWQAMKTQGGGVFVNLSSLASFDPFPHFSAYAASKAAVNMFTHCTAKEGAEFSIKAVAIAPGAIETDMFRALFTEDEFGKDLTMEPQAVAELISDCVTGDIDYEPGQVIRITSS